MALHTCPDCEAQISGAAEACPHCGRPVTIKTQASTPVQAPPKADGLTPCPRCGKRIQPVVTSVGGGSCSIGSRETWKCPTCRSVIHRSGCFIATAAYASEDAVEVQFLREFRDKVLLQLPLGPAAVRLYYRTSPSVASLIARSQLLRRSARRLLDGVVVVIEKSTSLSRPSVRERMKLGADEGQAKAEATKEHSRRAERKSTEQGGN